MNETIPQVLAVLLLTACGASEAAPETASPPSLCGGHAFTVVAAPPAPDGPTATLVVTRRGEGMAGNEKGTCVQIGDETTVVEPGAEATFAVAAHDRLLQRLVVGGRLVLAPIEPNGTIRLHDQPCFGWALSATWLDPFAADSDRAYCRDPGEACREGYSPAGPPGPVVEPLCAAHGEDDSARRCLRNAEVRFVGPASAELRLHRFGDEAGEAIDVGSTPPPSRELAATTMPWHCGEAEVATSLERAMLLLPAAAGVDVMVGDKGALRARLGASIRAKLD